MKLKTALETTENISSTLVEPRTRATASPSTIEGLRERAEELSKDDYTRELVRGMRPSWWRILVYMMAGKSQIDTAKALGISSSTVSRLWNNNRFRTIFDMFNLKRNETMTENFAMVSEAADKHSVMAEEILAEIMQDDTLAASARVSASKHILDMAGHKPKEKLEITEQKPVILTMGTDTGYNKMEDPYYQIKKDLGQTDPDEEKDEEMESDLAMLDAAEAMIERREKEEVVAG